MVKLGGNRDTLEGHMAPRRIESAQVERLVRHALDRVAHEHDRDAILRIALLNAGERAIPQRPGALTGFVLGALRDAVVEFVGQDAAHSMVRSLKPLLKMKSELELPAPGGDASDAEAPDGPTVIVVDADLALRAKLVRWLREDGYCAVSAPDAMVALAMSVRRRPDLLVIDIDQDTSARQVQGLLGVAFGAEAPSTILLSRYERSSEEALPKPLEREVFMAKVASLNLSSGPSPAEAPA